MKIKNIVFSALMIGAISFNSASVAMISEIDVSRFVAAVVGGSAGATAGLIFGAQKGYALGATRSLGSVGGAVVGGTAGAATGVIAGMMVAYLGLEITRAVQKKIKERREKPKHYDHIESVS